MKFRFFILVLALALCLSACGKKTDPTPDATAPSTAQQTAKQPQQPNDAAPQTDPEPAGPAEEPTPNTSEPTNEPYRPSITLGDGTVLALEEIAGAYTGECYAMEKRPDGSTETGEKEKGAWAIFFVDDGLYITSGDDLAQLAFNEERFVYSVSGREGKVDLMPDGDGILRLHCYETDADGNAVIIDASRTASQDDALLERFREYQSR